MPAHFISGTKIDMCEEALRLQNNGKTTSGSNLPTLKRMKTIWKIALSAALLCLASPQLRAQSLALKGNAVYLAALAPNVGAEVAIGRYTTLDLFGAYKPWTVRENGNLRFWLVQPEVRYWLCERFEGHFFGIHLHAAQYYMHRKGDTYDGYLAGGGLTYGYDWALSPRWNIEALIGIGYARLWYRQSPDMPCEKCSTDKSRDYFGPTRISIGFSYLF